MLRDEVPGDTSTRPEYSPKPPNISLCPMFARKVFEFENETSSPDLLRALHRKMSHFPLSPILEKTTGLEEYDRGGDDTGFSDPLVAPTPIGKTPVDYSGWVFTDVSFVVILLISDPQWLRLLESGFCDSFTSGTGYIEMQNAFQAKFHFRTELFQKDQTCSWKVSGPHPVSQVQTKWHIIQFLGTCANRGSMNFDPAIVRIW